MNNLELSPEPVKNIAPLNTKSYFIVTLVLNNLVESSYLFSEILDARNKFVDLCREFCPNWRDTNIDLALEQEYWKIQNGSININKPVSYERKD